VQLTEQTSQKIHELAHRHGVSPEAVLLLFEAIVQGNGNLAQFNHPELGGAGQWMRGGMTMVGDLFDQGLKSKVDALCNELSRLAQPYLAGSGSPSASLPSAATGSAASDPVVGDGPTACVFRNWWPADLGIPDSAGGQDRVRYAYFGKSKRLAVEVDGRVTIYDTLGHQIHGISQHQGTTSSLHFTSSEGPVDVASLPVVSGPGSQNPAGPAPA